MSARCRGSSVRSAATVVHDGSRAGRRAHGGERSDRATEHGAERRDRLRALFDVAAFARNRSPGDPHLLAVTIYDSSGVARAWAGRPSTSSRADQGRRRPVRDAIAAGAAPRLHPTHRRSRAQRTAGSAAVEHVITPAPRGTGAQRGLAQLPHAHIDRAGLAAAAGRRRG